MVEGEYFEEILDNVVSAFFTLGPDMTVRYRNRVSAELVPTIKPGLDIWGCLRPLTNEEKIDRLLLHGERVVFSPGPDLPLLEWLMSPHHLADGGRAVMVWDATILDELVEQRIAFVVGASHELRSPLTALLGFAEILDLERETLTPQQAEATDVILQNARHLDAMVEDILDLTKSSFGELQLNLESLDLAQIVTGVIDSLRPQIEDKGQTLEFGAEPGLPAIEVDPQRIKQVVFNLLQNAHGYSPPGSTIKISTSEGDEELLLTVSDNGDGLPFADADDAFESFKRGQTTGTAARPGSGIGLTIVKRLVELHRGSIKVSSEPGVGTAFTVRLPLDREKARYEMFPLQ